jgi:hypothetical protein
MGIEARGAVDDRGMQEREGGERRPERCQRERVPAAGGGWTGLLRARGLMLLFCVAGLPLVRAGTFLSGSVRWEKVDDTTARFDVVTYWKRSFSPFANGKAVPGVSLDIIAQATVSINFGDGNKRFLRAIVTNINENEDWLEVRTGLPPCAFMVMTISLVCSFSQVVHCTTGCHDVRAHVPETRFQRGIEGDLRRGRSRERTCHRAAVRGCVHAVDG